MRFRTAVPISAGATGRVLRVYDEVLGCDVALKLLHRDDPEQVQRMLREAHAQARLDHPHIGKVHGTGTLDGQPYIAMQFIDGRTLDQAATGLSDRAKAALLADVADALVCAHGAGMVHRDLKPSNIMVARDDEGRLHPYVIDFGLVHDAGTDDLTRTGQLLGTPGYIAPEVAADSQAVDGRADLYSLGVVLFELLAGRRPFLGESAAALIVQSLRREPPSLLSVRPDADPALARIVRQCLERDPGWRYPDAAALRDDLRAFRDGRRVSARHDGIWRRSRRFALNHPWRAALAGASATLVLGLIALAVHSTWYARDQALKAQRYMDFAGEIEGSIRQRYLMPAHDTAPGLERLQQRVAEFAKAMPARGPAASRAGQLALGRARAALGDNAAARIHLLRAWAAGERSSTLDQLLGEVHLRLYWQALREAGAITDPDLRERRIAEANEGLRTPAQFHLAQAAAADRDPSQLAPALLMHLGGDHDAANALLEQAADRLDWPIDALLFAGEQLQQAAAQALLDGDADAAAALAREADQRYRRAASIARSHPVAAEGLCILGGHLAMLSREGVHVVEEDMASALAWCDTAISLDTSRAQSHASKSASLASHAVLQRMRAQPPDALVDEAIGAARTAIRLAPASLGARSALGSLLVTRGRWALETGVDDRTGINEAIALLEQAHAGDPGDIASALNLADAHHLQAQFVELEGADPDPHYLRAEQVLAAVAPAANAPPAIEAKLAETRAWRGYYQYRAGRDAESLLRANYDRIRLVRHRVPSHTPVDRAFAYSAWTLAELLALLGRNPSAEAEAALDAYEGLLARNHDDFTSLFNSIGPQVILIDHRLREGRDVGTDIARLEEAMNRLRALAGDRTPIDVHLLELAVYQARNDIVRGRDPRDRLAEARRRFALAVENPVDRHAALEVFADLVHVDHAWRQANARPDPALWAQDSARLEHALSTYPDSPMLMVRVALAFSAAPEGRQRIRLAEDVLATALARMPFLAERLGPERERLATLAASID